MTKKESTGLHTLLFSQVTRASDIGNDGGFPIKAAFDARTNNGRKNNYS